LTARSGRKCLETLLRENKASLIRERWLADLSQATELQTSALSLVDVETTVTLRKTFFQRIKSGSIDLHRYWPKENLADVLSFLSPLAREIGSEQVTLFSNVDQYLGAVQLPAGPVLRDISRVWKAVGQDLSMTTGSGDDGICLEENYYDSDGNYIREGIYELSAWGLFVPR
jgi:hypothetical protein